MESVHDLFQGKRHAMFDHRLPETNVTYQMMQDDATWSIASSFIIFTMSSGFGLLESGRVSAKDEVNIMIKCVVDIVFGGLAYWAIGFGLIFGDSWFPNQYIGLGKFFFDPSDELEVVEGWNYSSFLFKMSCATTTSTIISAGLAERVRLRSYILVTFLLTAIVHPVAAHWVWTGEGVLYQLGVIDAAGCLVVHLVGGVAGTVATVYLRPRQNRFGKASQQQMSNPTNAILGTFILWWGWLAFNTASTYGVTHLKWALVARAAISTVVCSVAGGGASILYSRLVNKTVRVDNVIDGLLAALVISSANCMSVNGWAAVFCGAVGSTLALSSTILIERFEIDDPVGLIPVHVVGGIWGMLCVGVFSDTDHYNEYMTRGAEGLIAGGGFRLLLVQFVSCVAVILWAATSSFAIIFLVAHSPIGLRLSKYEEQLGADLVEHALCGRNITRYRMEKKLTTQAFTSVMKAILRWKRMTKAGRDRRQAAIDAATRDVCIATLPTLHGHIEVGSSSSPQRTPQCRVPLEQFQLERRPVDVSRWPLRFRSRLWTND